MEGWQMLEKWLQVLERMGEKIFLDFLQSRD
jgi:hypothetical protein